MIRVLIAEDEFLVRIGVKNSIPWEKYGMSVIADVSNGKEAWDVYEKERPDLIITDIRMPVMDGMELIKRIRDKDHTTNIIILTCLSEFELARNALSMGVNEYILKLTMTPDEMEQIIAKISLKITSRPEPAAAHANIGAERVEKKLKDFLFGGHYSVDDFIALTEGHAADRLMFCLMEIDHYEALKISFSDDQGHLTEMNLINVLNSVIGTYERVHFEHEQKNRFILLIRYSDSLDTEQVQLDIESFLQHLRQVFSTYFNTTVSFGLSNLGSGFTQIKQLYNESQKALEMKFVFGEGSTIGYSPESSRQLRVRTRDILHELEYSWEGLDEALRQGLYEQIHIFKAAERLGITEWLNFFVRLIQVPLLTVRLQGDTIWGIHEHASVNIRSSRTVKEAMLTFQSYLNQLIQCRVKTPQWSKEVTAVVHYIEMHYKENITLQQLAAHVNLSANYFSTLFKKETKCSPIDYLIQYRICKAKELLLDTDYPISEIADGVGIHDYSYFSRIFKKMTGVNPKFFRISPERNEEYPRADQS